jgi:hypothetical protein
LSQEAKEHIDALAGGTFFMLNVKEARALFEKLSALSKLIPYKEISRYGSHPTRGE